MTLLEVGKPLREGRFGDVAMRVVNVGEANPVHPGRRHRRPVRPRRDRVALTDLKRRPAFSVAYGMIAGHEL